MPTQEVPAHELTHVQPQLKLVPANTVEAKTKERKTLVSGKPVPKTPLVKVRYPREGHSGFVIEWKRHPDTHKSGSISLGPCPAFDVDSKGFEREEKNAFRRAKAKSDELVSRKLAIKLGAPRLVTVTVTVQERFAIDAECEAYYQFLVNEGSSKHSLRNASDTLNEFVLWLAAKKIYALSELDAKWLKAWHTSRCNALKANGEKYAKSSINQDFKIVRAMLRRAAASVENERGRHFTGDMLRGAIPHLTLKKKEKKPIRVLNVTEIRSVLRAALAHDEATESGPYAAPDIALGLLTGLRRFELAALVVGEVQLDRPSDWQPDILEDRIDLPGCKAKGGNARKVYLTKFTKLGVELVHEIIRGRRASEWLSENTYQQLGDLVFTLANIRNCACIGDRTCMHKAPAFSLKDLRSTCCTCELNLPVPQKLILERQGHTERVAMDNYFSPATTMVVSDTLEGTMLCEVELREVIVAIRARNDRGITPRLEARADSAPKLVAVNVLKVESGKS